MISSKPSGVLLLSILAAGLFVSGCATQRATHSTRPSTGQEKTALPGKVSAPGVMFDGRTLNGWAITDFAGHGFVVASNGQINVGMGHMTGVTWTNEMPRMGYEISLEARRMDGSDFFCGLTFPVGNEFLSFIVGGWGGGVVGLSSINGEDASQNETTTYMNFVTGRWYQIRVRVVPGRVQAWIDEDRVVDVETAEKQLGIRVEMEVSKPLGLATWNTAAAWRNIQLKKL